MLNKNDSKKSKFIDGMIIFIFFVACSLFLFSCSNKGSDVHSKASGAIYTQKLSDEDYNSAVNLAKQGKWHDCTIKLVRSHEGDNRAKILYAYANAQESYEKNDFRMAQHYLKDIPDNYSGDFSDTIKQMKTIISDKVVQQVAKEKQAKVAEEKEKAKHIYIGDSEEKIRKVFGDPDRVNRHVNASGTTKQYVYYQGNKMICIYTENGIVTDFQD